MSTQEAHLPTVSPDFDGLALSFKTYLSQQSEYTDHDFGGSGLSTIIDVLSLNSHYLAFFLNQVANESFLYTAIKRSSAVARANGLSYIPRTASAASALLQYEFLKVNPSDVFVPFSVTPEAVAMVGNEFYTFSSTSTVDIKEVNGRYISEPFTVYEGNRFTYRQTTTQNVLTNGVIIPNLNVDITQTTVDVVTSMTTTTYTLASDIINIKDTDNCFFYYENADGRIVIQFGDGVIGTQPPLGSTIAINYLVCSGSLANEIDSFTASNALSSGRLVALTVNKSSGGDEPESITSIKNMAPLMYTTQKRAVINTDYTTILKSLYTNIDDAIAYGGEEVDPPQYGKVIIVVKPKSGLYLTSYDKINIANFIKKYNIISVTPVIQEPDYIYINLNINVLYDYTKLSSTESALTDKINAAITAYEDSQLSSFDKDFRYSVFLRSIDFCDKSIIANTTKVLLEKKLSPPLGSKTFIEITYNNAITKGSIVTTAFTYAGKSNCFIDDSLNGSLTIYRYQNNVKTVIASDIGTVDYSTGKISIPNIIITSLDNADNVNTQTGEKYFSIHAAPVDYDVAITQRNIGQINTVKLSLIRGNA